MSTIQDEARLDLARGAARSRAERAVEVALCLALPAVVFSFSSLFYPAFQPLKEALLMALGAALFAIALAAGWLTRLPKIWTALVTLYCASILAAWAASYRPDLGAGAAFAMLAGPLLACSAVAIVRRRMLLIEVIAATGAMEAAVAFAQWVVRWDPHQVFSRERLVLGFLAGIPAVRPIGTIGNSDVVALVIAASFPAALTLIADRRRSRASRLLWLGMAVIDLAAIAGTACRSSLLGALAGGAVVAISRLEHLRRRTVLTMLAIACLLGAAFVAARIANRRNRLDLVAATAARTFAWRVAASRWPGNILFGAGPGTFHFTYLRLQGDWLREHNFEGVAYAGSNSDAQNDLLQTRLETGWPGLVALVALLAFWTRAAISGARSPDPEQRAAVTASLGGVLALAIVAMVETSLQYAPSRMLIWLWMALPLTYTAGDERPSRRFAAARWLFAIAVCAVFAWDSGGIALSRFMTERGYRREFAGELAGAVDDERRAVAADPANCDARFHLGRAQWKAGDSAGALRALDDAVLCDSQPRAYEMRIRVLYYSGRFPEAVRRATEATRIFPWFPDFQRWHDRAAARIITSPPPAERRP